MRSRFALLLLVVLSTSFPGVARAEWRPLQVLRERVQGKAALQAQARARACLIRSCIQTHSELKAAKVPLPLPDSNVLSTATARAKTYGDSWTCRESSRLLIQRLGGSGQRLVLDSSGKNAFQWGNEGLVSFHYYGVDDPGRTRLLVDPTAHSNFARDVQPGGLMRQYLEEAGRERQQPAAAERVRKRLERGGDLLILANPAEIAVYRDALERAASRLRNLSRDSQRR